MRIVETSYKRFKSVQSSPDFEFFTVLTNESISMWNTRAFREELAKKNENDLMCEIEPQRDIAQKMRLLCCAINIITESQFQRKKEAKTSKNKQKQKVSEKSKKIKKKKVSKDEKKILNMQKAE